MEDFGKVVSVSADTSQNKSMRNIFIIFLVIEPWKFLIEIFAQSIYKETISVQLKFLTHDSWNGNRENGSNQKELDMRMRYFCFGIAAIMDVLGGWQI